jgi:uncharacterized membrane protein SpoIIM required for sporulation
VSPRATLVSRLTERAFVEARSGEWTELDHLARKCKRGIRRLDARDAARLSPLYRNVCGDLARAQSARYTASLVDYLSGLVAEGHTLLYGPHARPARRRGEAALVAFPRALRRRWRAMGIAFLLFFVPMQLGLGLTLRDPAFAFQIAPEGMLRPLAEAYAEGFAKGRDAGEGVMMAGFYVNNNVGIALRCFSLGVFGGIGSAIYLVQNGLSIGAILGYVTSQGAGANILTFVLGHGTFELGAIVISGGAGLSLGWAIVAPGDRTRLASVREVATDLFVIVCGASAMLLVAAGLEAFWSPSSLPSEIKHVAGAVFLVLVCAYLALAGRGGAAPLGEDAP